MIIDEKATCLSATVIFQDDLIPQILFSRKSITQHNKQRDSLWSYLIHNQCDNASHTNVMWEKKM